MGPTVVQPYLKFLLAYAHYNEVNLRNMYGQDDGPINEMMRCVNARTLLPSPYTKESEQLFFQLGKLSQSIAEELARCFPDTVDNPTTCYCIDWVNCDGPSVSYRLRGYLCSEDPTRFERIDTRESVSVFLAWTALNPKGQWEGHDPEVQSVYDEEMYDWDTLPSHDLSQDDEVVIEHILEQNVIFLATSARKRRLQVDK